jgi:IS605 OrfB family transposase
MPEQKYSLRCVSGSSLQSPTTSEETNRAVRNYEMDSMTRSTIANELVDEAVENDCSHIVFEDLTHIRENIPEAKWQHIWAFRRLYGYVEYKAPERGVEVVQVDARNTSKRCSTCGFVHDKNRRQESFRCQKCGYENHADYNASKNIGFRYLRRRQNAGDGGAPVGVRLNRGTLNVSGEYSPASDGQNGSPRESPRL